MEEISISWKSFPFCEMDFNGVKAHSTSQGPLENKGEKVTSL
jgi:hypothetical protein